EGLTFIPSGLRPGDFPLDEIYSEEISSMVKVEGSSNFRKKIKRTDFFSVQDGVETSEALVCLFLFGRFFGLLGSGSLIILNFA
ncbi:MAG: hypothetical protein M3Q64_02905, partial [bacterium]|nr:hypothetical protein [bacterium]